MEFGLSEQVSQSNESLDCENIGNRKKIHRGMYILLDIL